MNDQIPLISVAQTEGAVLRGILDKIPDAHDRH